MWSLIGASPAARPPALDILALTAFLAVILLLTCHANARQAPVFILGSAVAGAVAAVCGVLQGAWPFSIAEAVWAAAAVQRWWMAIHQRPGLITADDDRGNASRETKLPAANRLPNESRLTRLFGTK